MKSLIDDLERAGSILVSTSCMASMSCFSLVALELFGWDSIHDHNKQFIRLSLMRFNKTIGRSMKVIIGVLKVLMEWLVSIKFEISEVAIVLVLDSKLEIFSVKGSATSCFRMLISSL